VATAEHETVVEHLTRAEIRDELERLAPERLGMTGAEFFERWHRGDLDDFDPKVARLAVLARLLTN
jgi:hypothetical protein